MCQMPDEAASRSEPRLAAGEQLGPYRIEALLGEGGMGQVYKGRDTRLGRTIAVKVCHADFTSRFEREARAIATLNHPNICTLHDVGPNYLVMELVEGETLAARLRRGPLPPADVVRYGAQMADALAAAHSRGIIHRDLKPGNIMVTKTGIKVLDFGLAKIAADPDATLTVSGAVMGTPAYMAPEQLDGICDARTDIFALGLVLYEIATGKRLHAGEARSLDGVPRQLAHVIERCLEADPPDRWQAASDVKRELEWAARSDSAAVPAGPRNRALRIAALAGAAAFLLLVAWSLASLRPGTSEPVPLRLTVDAPAGADFGFGLAISPDARVIAFIAHTAGPPSLWLRPLNSLTAREIPGTDDAAYPFWSPDSRSVGFFAGGKLKRADVRTGAVTDICAVSQGRGGTWNSNGTILFNSVNDGPLLRVPASGGAPEPLTRLDGARGENSHRWPWFLPGGRKFLYYVRGAIAGAAGIYVGSLDEPQRKRLVVSSRSNGIYVPPVRTSSGYLMWVRDGNLLAQPFDPGDESLKGAPITLAERVGLLTAGGLAEVSVASDATLVYRMAAMTAYQLAWYRRDGTREEAIGAPDVWRGVRLSPDGKRIAVSRPFSPGGQGGIALIEPSRGIPTPFVTAFMGAWSPDGQRLAYAWSQAGRPNIYVKPITGAGEQVRVTESEGSQTVHDWSSDGRYLVFNESSNDLAATSPLKVWIVPLEGDRKPFPHDRTRGAELRAQFSPDGRWLAYTSDEDGRAEVYVESFPAGSAKWKISFAGDDYARWRRDGKELFYLSRDGTLMGVPVRANRATAEFGSAAALFKISVPAGATVGDYPYDIAREGRFLALTPTGDSPGPSLAVLLNWESDLH
jgi:eukaryotic-like serine/threonine-protein kinase